MSNYPENIDSFAPVTGSDEMTEHAERHTAEESSIVAIETVLGVDPQGESDTVADRLVVQETDIAANTKAIDDIVIPDLSGLATTTELEAGDEATLNASKTYTDEEIGKIVIPDVSNFATTTELEAGDEATLESANEYTDEEIAKIVIPDVSTFATTTYVDAADKNLQDQIDTIQSSGYDDTQIRKDFADADAAIQTEVEANAAAIADNTTAIEAIKTYDDTVLSGKVDGNAAAIAANATAIGENTTAIEAIETYDDTVLAGKVNDNTTAIADNATAISDNTLAIQANTQAIDDIVIPDTSSFATTTYVDEADGALQEQIDAIETYDDTVLSAQVDTNTQTLSELTTATLPLDQPEDPTAVFATLNTQLDANQYFAQELETKVTEGTTWGALAGRP